MHGARVVALRGNFDEALALVRQLCAKHPIALVNSVNPYRLEGQKTAAFEVVADLGGAPDALCIPVGNAGNVTAWWRGFVEEEVAPRLFGFQAAGAAPLVEGHPIAKPETIASAIRIGNPARWEEAMEAMTASRGMIRAVTDDEILDAWRLLAAREGVFCEPASAASVAGLLRYGADGTARIVCVLTGHGLKDPQTALDHAGRRRAVRAAARRRRAGRARLMERRRVVRVPGSSANLGPGFDAFAAALALHLELEVTETGSFSFETDLHVARDRRNLAVRALRAPAPAGSLRVPDAVGHPALRRPGLERRGVRGRAARRRPRLRAAARTSSVMRSRWRAIRTTSRRRCSAA